MTVQGPTSCPDFCWTTLDSLEPAQIRPIFVEVWRHDAADPGRLAVGQGFRRPRREAALRRAQGGRVRGRVRLQAGRAPGAEGSPGVRLTQGARPMPPSTST